MVPCHGAAAHRVVRLEVVGTPFDHAEPLPLEVAPRALPSPLRRSANSRSSGGTYNSASSVVSSTAEARRQEHSHGDDVAGPAEEPAVAAAAPRPAVQADAPRLQTEEDAQSQERPAGGDGAQSTEDLQGILDTLDTALQQVSDVVILSAPAFALSHEVRKLWHAA